MTDISDFLSGHEDCSFVEITCTQTYDRADMGYADEWQFLVRGKTREGKSGEIELLYHVGTNDDSLKEFREEYQSKRDEYMRQYPNISMISESEHHKKGIRQNQKFPLRRRV